VGEDRQGRRHARPRLTSDGQEGYEAEIRNARRFERLLAARSLVPIALVALIIAIYLHYH
jgi:hypothetical protein